MAPASSHLDKLFILLEKGDTAAIKNAAAEQIAGYVRSSPPQILSIASKVTKVLHNSDWAARIAAGRCMSLLAQYVQHHTVKDIESAANAAPTGGMRVTTYPETTRPAALDALDLIKVIAEGAPLLHSKGQAYKVQQSHSASGELLAKQRKTLAASLNLGGFDQAVNMNEIIADEDLDTHQGIDNKPPETLHPAPTKSSQIKGLSAREQNQLKRRQKHTPRGEPPSQRQKKDDAVLSAPVMDELHFDQEMDSILAGKWPFQHLCEQLLVECVNSSWEIRHGSLLALREILGPHAQSANIFSPVISGPSGWVAAGGQGLMHLRPCSIEDIKQAQQANNSWIENCIARLICVLALDRFGDYTSDQVVAPVRETAAQVLGAASKALEPPRVSLAIELLSTLQTQSDWSVRHGGLLGIKYALAARVDIAKDLLPTALPTILSALQDQEDDVRAVAAEALLPVASHIASQGASVLLDLQHTLWDLLLNLEDLSLSTGSVMQLLALLCKHISINLPEEQLQVFVPRLWPYFQHTLKTVRIASASCFCSMLASSSTPALHLNTSILSHGLRLTFQNLLLETDADMANISQELWGLLLQKADSELLSQSASAHMLSEMFDLASVADEQLPHHTKLFWVARQTGHKQSDLGSLESSSQCATSYIRLFEDFCAIQARLRAGTALGKLASSFPEGNILHHAGKVHEISSRILAFLSSSAASAKQLAGMTVLSWAMPSSNESSDRNLVSNEIVQSICIALSEPKAARKKNKISTYAELSPMYSKVQWAILQVLKKCSARGSSMSHILNGMAPEQFSQLLTAENAAEICKEVSRFEDGGSLNDDLATLQPMILALMNAENALHISVKASLACALVQEGSLPTKLNLVIQPLMAALRHQIDRCVQQMCASALAKLLGTTKLSAAQKERLVTNISNLAYSQEESKAHGFKQMTMDGVSARNMDVGDPTIALGGSQALEALSHYFGPQLFEALPTLHNLITQGLQAEFPSSNGTAICHSLNILKIAGPHMALELHHSLLDWLKKLPPYVQCPQAHIRSLAVGCAVNIAKSYPAVFVPLLLRLASSIMNGPQRSAAIAVEGAVQLLSGTIDALEDAIVPYVFLLVLPMMRCMSSQHREVSHRAASSFSKLVALVPLAKDQQLPPGLSADQIEAWHKDSRFLQQLTDNSKVQRFELPIEIAGDLRPYQQEGINWLAFLKQCGLHGVLADDMGLGKTLQAIAIIAATHAEAKAAGVAEEPTLIVCPQILVGHWPCEIAKFIGKGTLKAASFDGPPSHRQTLQPSIRKMDVVVMSYDTLRADIDWIGQHSWNYCVLDEGHIIGNPNSKTSQAAKRIIAKHRLILTGTPIQNGVQELWALFDFLMPGFLGTQQQFYQKFGKSQQNARSQLASKVAQASILALERLHKQVMPFILRRTKDAVLPELPPKILQDIVCKMSPLQAALYDWFSSSKACKEVESVLADPPKQRGDGSAANSPHIFQALQYLRKLCSHPLLVLDPSQDSHSALALDVTGSKSWKDAISLLRDLQHAPKLLALRELLMQCQIGVQDDCQKGNPITSRLPYQGHRVLVFAQFKRTLDFVEDDVMRPMNISYLRLDGSVEAGSRFGIVQRFNEDPSIEVMLLTTNVGGLGLNLTAADTVVFLEHDWNPMKDLQAMDRAHRLGQRKTVNVYRIIVKDSLEERVMSLQKFKVDVAKAVINQENVSLASMDTSALLDGLHREASLKQTTKPLARKSGGLNWVLQGLEELSDENQYAEEFSLENFMQKLS